MIHETDYAHEIIQFVGEENWCLSPIFQFRLVPLNSVKYTADQKIYDRTAAVLHWVIKWSLFGTRMIMYFFFQS
jgi:hypothetical protein